MMCLCAVSCHATHQNAVWYEAMKRLKDAVLVAWACLWRAINDSRISAAFLIAFYCEFAWMFLTSGHLLRGQN